MLKKTLCLCIILFATLCYLPHKPAFADATAEPDKTVDKSPATNAEILDALQYSAFLYAWNNIDQDSGLIYESSNDPNFKSLAIGGTGFGISAIVTAAERSWITREEALTRILKISTFLHDKTNRLNLHGAFPHWVTPTGETMIFSATDNGADIVETSLMIQGLLIAREYFNGPGEEERLRDIITSIWEEVDWNWFTNGENNGIYWHWSIDHGFTGLKILGFNECFITYVLAISSPTHPISREAYDYWTSGPGYKTHEAYGYNIQGTLPSIGPLFLTQYSFIGLDPTLMSDSFVTDGYFVRNVKQTLSNRAYALYVAPSQNKYSDSFWGITASTIPEGYQANEPNKNKDAATVAPTASITSMPYTPYYSMQVLQNLYNAKDNGLAIAKNKTLNVWGPYGPYDAISILKGWASTQYLAIDQLPMVSMVENYRTGMFWNLFMNIPDVQKGLEKAGVTDPEFNDGFPEAVLSMIRIKNSYKDEAYVTMEHPDLNLFLIPYWTKAAKTVYFDVINEDGACIKTIGSQTQAGRNMLAFQLSIDPKGELWKVIMKTDDAKYELPIRLFK